MLLLETWRVSEVFKESQGSLEATLQERKVFFLLSILHVQAEKDFFYPESGPRWSKCMLQSQNMNTFQGLLRLKLKRFHAIPHCYAWAIEKNVTTRTFCLVVHLQSLSPLYD